MPNPTWVTRYLTNNTWEDLYNLVGTVVAAADDELVAIKKVPVAEAEGWVEQIDTHIARMVQQIADINAARDKLLILKDDLEDAIVRAGQG